MIGTLLNDRFRLEEKIGSGGMSTVYRAFDETLERSVAIKIMHREISDDPNQLERFRREAKAVARLSNPHVVTVIDAGEDGGHPYIVFEHIGGETLKERIKRRGRLPVTEAIAYAVEIGRALAAAHAQRLIHRDVKPQNVLIDAEGRAKVTDFGIARSLEADGGLTATGRVLGTTDYVAPEQALGEQATERSDVYSLGICLYEMLTGALPFKADTQVGVAMKHVRDPLPDVRRACPEASAMLAAIVERATAKEAKNRYAGVEELVGDLERALAIEAARGGEAEGEATTVLQRLAGDTAELAPVRLRRPRRALATALLLAATIAAAGVVVAIRSERGTRGGAAPVEGALTPVQLVDAHDFDPDPGDGQEHSRSTGNAIDGNRTTFWDTESYVGGELNKPGVGLYVEAAEPIAARQLRLISPIPGWSAEVYAAGTAPEAIEGWTKVGGPVEAVDETQEIPLDTRGRRFRLYLVWIVSLPEGERQAAISELSVQR